MPAEVLPELGEALSRLDSDAPGAAAADPPDGAGARAGAAGGARAGAAATSAAISRGGVCPGPT
eukprot:SAG22_NODE_212_length_15072_cov_3.109197_17_plen_64_part_00